MWRLLKETVLGFIDDDALSSGAAIAFYTVTSLAPVLLLVIAVAGLVFGHDAAQSAMLQELGGLMGQQAAGVLQSALASASTKSSGIIAGIIGIVTLIVTASGVFGEMQAALNRIWRAKPSGATVSRLIRARAASLGLVAALGFLLAASLAVSTALEVLGQYLDARLPFGTALMSVANFIVSLVLLSLLFASIYKVLPDRPIVWRDVLIGALATAILFTVGKSLIGWYLGSSAVASSYGAAGGLILLFLWVYYSAQVFLLGAEFTKAYATRRGRGPAAARAGAAPEFGQAVAFAQHGSRALVLRPEDEPDLTALQRAEREAERHRAALVHTVITLEHRLRPSVMRRRMGRVVRHKAALLRSKSRQHPVQVAAALGVAALTGVAIAATLNGGNARRSADDRHERG